MSRGGGDDYEEDFPNQAQFWWANTQRALKGKRGRQALMELREALLMLPEKRLVSGAISTVSLAVKAQAMPDERQGAGGRSYRNYTKDDAIAKCEEEGPGVCAVGAYLLRKRVLATGETPEEAMAALPSHADVEDRGLDDTAQLGKEAGLTYSLAWLLAEKNDEVYGSLTPEQRYEKYLAWLDKELELVPA